MPAAKEATKKAGATPSTLTLINVRMHVFIKVVRGKFINVSKGNRTDFKLFS